MNEYLKKFLHRGLLFGGFGPIVAAVVFAILELFIDELVLSGGDILLAVASTYALAFVQAGATVFNQIEHWPVTKSLLCHFTLLFASYTSCYILNEWIPFEPSVILIFCLVFILTYFIIWFAVYFSVKSASRRFNEKLESR